MLGSATARGELGALAGFAICVAALVRKLRIEERWMLGQFGEEYARYSAATPALIPRPH